MQHEYMHVWRVYLGNEIGNKGHVDIYALGPEQAYWASAGHFHGHEEQPMATAFKLIKEVEGTPCFGPARGSYFHDESGYYRGCSKHEL